MKPLDMMRDWQRGALEQFFDSGLLEFCTRETRTLAATGMLTLEDVLEDPALKRALVSDLADRVEARSR